MPLLGFHTRFAEAVRNGAELAGLQGDCVDGTFGRQVTGVLAEFIPSKRQTIRAYRKDGRDPKAGDTLHLWTGLRQKGARKLGEVTCQSVTPVAIWPSSGVVRLDGPEIDEAAKLDLAVRDGFEDFEAMRQWFLTARRAGRYSSTFTGLVIRW